MKTCYWWELCLNADLAEFTVMTGLPFFITMNIYKTLGWEHIQGALQQPRKTA